MKGITVHPDEFDALMRLDAAMLSPESKPDSDDARTPVAPRATAAWPTRPGSAPVTANG